MVLVAWSLVALVGAVAAAVGRRPFFGSTRLRLGPTIHRLRLVQSLVHPSLWEILRNRLASLTAVTKLHGTHFFVEAAAEEVAAAVEDSGTAKNGGIDCLGDCNCFGVAAVDGVLLEYHRNPLAILDGRTVRDDLLPIPFCGSLVPETSCWVVPGDTHRVD